MTERWAEIDAILDAALDLQEADRPAYLVEACAGDAALLAEVEALLVACAVSGGFLEDPAYVAAGPLMEAMLAQEPSEGQLAADEAVGPYRIIKPLGRGGMGIVYLAERADGTFQKQVALKVVKRGMDTEEINRRFRYERQILARLEHPNIARLLDGGVTAQGVPYFVMEYVDGEPVDTYCDARQLSIADRLKLFEIVCTAVQYAHRNLVVHRDLKPSNILVTEEGQVKLLDFGIAKVLVPDLPAQLMPVTVAEGRMMTPEYAAPEQVRGEPTTTATDVYALGIILYQLLCGRHPYVLKNHLLAELEVAICHTVPHRPSSVFLRPPETESAALVELSRQRGTQPQRLQARLSGDLDAITLKALKKEPELRYASAAELLADLQRYRQGWTVVARDDTFRYRTVRFVQRHKAVVTLATLAVLLLLGGIVATTWQARLAHREADRATRALRYVVRTFEQVNPEETEDGTKISVSEIVAASLLEIQGLNEAPVDQATIMTVAARLSFTLGASAYFDLADSLYREAVVRLKDVLGPGHPDVAEALEGRAAVLMAKYLPEPAEALYREALTIHAKAYGQEDPRVLKSLNGLAESRFMQNQLHEADTLYRRAVALWARNEQATQETVTSLNGLARVSYLLGHLDEADTLYRASLQILEADPRSKLHEKAQTMFYLAQLLQGKGALAEAEGYFRESLRLYRQVYGDVHLLVANFTCGLAEVLRERGKLVEAEQLYARGDSLYLQILPSPDAPERRWRFYSLWGLGKVRLDRGDPRGAEAYLRTSLEMIGEVSAHPTLTAVHAWLGRALLAQGRYAEAEALLVDSYAYLQTQPPEQDVLQYLAETRTSLLTLYRQWGKPDQLARYKTQQP